MLFCALTIIAKANSERVILKYDMVMIGLLTQQKTCLVRGGGCGFSDLSNLAKCLRKFITGIRRCVARSELELEKLELHYLRNLRATRL